MQKRLLNMQADKIEMVLAAHKAPARVWGGRLTARTVQFLTRKIDVMSVYLSNEWPQIEKRANVKFNVCAIAMKNQQVEKSQLLPNIQTVPDGIGEIVSKQNAGWGYIKVGH